MPPPPKKHTHTPSEVERAALPAFPNDDLGTVHSLEALAAEQEEDLGPLRVREKGFVGLMDWIDFMGARGRG